jgi:hypothetical protein
VSIVQLAATVHIEKLDMRACRGYRRPEVIAFVLDYLEFLHKNSHNDDGIDTAHWHSFSLELMLAHLYELTVVASRAYRLSRTGFEVWSVHKWK